MSTLSRQTSRIVPHSQQTLREYYSNGYINKLANKAFELIYYFQNFVYTSNSAYIKYYHSGMYIMYKYIYKYKYFYINKAYIFTYSYMQLYTLM